GTIKQEDRLTENMTARMSGFMKPAKLQYLGKKTKIMDFWWVEMLKSWMVDGRWTSGAHSHMGSIHDLPSTIHEKNGRRFTIPSGHYHFPWLILSLAQVRMRSRNRIGSFLARAIFNIYRVFIPTYLTVAEDKAVGVDAFFFNQVFNHFIYPVPAQLLGRFAGFAVTYHSYFTTRVIPHFLCNAGGQRLAILAQRN